MKVALKVLLPEVRTEAPGSTAVGSFEVKLTKPANPVATLAFESNAVTVKFTGLPAVLVEGRFVRTRLVAGPGTTVTLAEFVKSVPSMEAESVTNPAVVPVKEIRYVPSLSRIGSLIVPLPAPVFRMISTCDGSGIPWGERFWKASRGVIVASIVDPETTVALVKLNELAAAE